MAEREEAAESSFSPAEDGADTPEEFQCSICLDLLYKPVVLACGHICCFWCVNSSMNYHRESHCPLCRQAYKYFPSICPLLHHLLLKKDPAAYKRREKEVFEQEKKRDCFSPQVIEPLASGFFIEEPNNASATNYPDGIARKILMSDVLCLGCQKILFHPSVLNCGHSFCEACMADQVHEIKCQICESVNPGDLPKICLDLDYFVKSHFPTEHAQRLTTFQSNRAQDQKAQSSSAFSNAKKSKKSSLFVETDNGTLVLADDLSNMHLGVGCDTCGMYPIIGKRYRCKDCKEAIGFDLCEACYNTSSKRPGRFNQQHTPDHVLVLDDSKMLANILRWSVEVEDDQHDLVDEGDH